MMSQNISRYFWVYLNLVMVHENCRSSFQQAFQIFNDMETHRQQEKNLRGILAREALNQQRGRLSQIAVCLVNLSTSCRGFHSENVQYICGSGLALFTIFVEAFYLLRSTIK